MNFVRSGFVGGGFCPNLNNYDRLRKTIHILGTGGYVLHKPRVYPSQDFGAKMTMMKSPVLNRVQSVEEKEK